ncbi:MAG: hypothetical protein L3J73_04790 [Thermoplasmata archaeon]|nr:hypothetical protein [Thermoplasmata archaeon]
MDERAGPPTTVPFPDERVRLPREALNAVEWLDGESVRSVWTSGPAFLVISSLRCVLLTKGDGLRRPLGWSAGVEYFFFNFAPPRIVGLSDVELSEEFLEGRTTRLAVPDPIALATALADARAEGREAWNRRRASDVPTLPQERPWWPATERARSGEPWVGAVKLPCTECGNLYDAASRRCPSCGTPRGTGPR